MFSSKIRFSVLSAAVTLAAAAPFSTAQATNGQLPTCIGTYKCGMGGAGLTIASDPTAAAINPALAARMGNSAILSVGAFKADVQREIKGNGGVVNTAGGKQTSEADTFANGSMGVNYGLSDGKALNISLYPGGGGATNWTNPRTAGQVNSGADSDITWRMFNLQAALAYTLNPSTAIGGGIVLSRATMKTDAPDGNGNLDSGLNQVKTSNGVGFQFGAVHDINSTWSIAGDVHSKVWHQRFEGLTSVFNSSVDRPATMAIGFDYKHSPETQFAFDIKRVFNSTVDTISTEPLDEGGFGWNDTTILMIGAQHMVSDSFQIRAGYNYGESPIDDEHVFANILFPAIIEHHFTAGMNYAVTDTMELGWSGYWTPVARLTDTGTGDNYSVWGVDSKLWHQQYGTQVSLKYNF
jgi:long-chain fatty acid transport protein